MTVITFDSHPFIKQLVAAGIPEKQAEAQVKTMAEIMKETLDDKIATKHDLQILKTSIHRDMSDLKSELKQDMSNLTFKVGGMIAGGATITLTLMPVVFKLINLI